MGKYHLAKQHTEKGGVQLNMSLVLKLVIERTLTSMNETVYLLMHDMSKAFDSINRATLIKDLDRILQKDELHLVNKMLNVELSVTRGSYNSEYFKTDTGAR